MGNWQRHDGTTTALTADQMLDELLALRDPKRADWLDTAITFTDREAEFIDGLGEWRLLEYPEGIGDALTERQHYWLRDIHKEVRAQLQLATGNDERRTA